MQKVKTYIGFSKTLIDLRVQVGVFFHFTPYVFKGKISLRHYFKLLRRLLFFLGMMKHNKYVKMDKSIKMNLYVPPYPTPAFFHACKKMMAFEGKLPCISALISVTSACRYKCEHCYQKFDKGPDVDIEVLIDVVKNLQNKGIAFFNIEGGEPFLVYDKLLKLCKAIDQRSEIVINSTGDGITRQRLKELKDLGNVTAIMFSLHSSDAEKLNSFTGNPEAWSNMVKATEMCVDAGISVMFNSCLQKDDFSNGEFERVIEVAKSLNGILVQLIKPKPAGGWLGGGVKLFTPADVEFLRKKVNDYNLNKKYIDYPFVYSQLLEEESNMFGCTAGGTDRFYINAKGDLQPCEFLNISFGNIQNHNFDEIYNQMRNTFHQAGDCWLCEEYARQINEKFVQNSDKILPLNPEQSKEIYKNWNRGERPYFYKEVEN